MIALRPSRPGRSVWASCSSIISSSTCLARASQGALGHAPSLLSDVRNDAEVPRRSRTAEFFRDYLMQVMKRARGPSAHRSEEHTSELQSLMRISYAVFCLKKKTTE